MRKGKVALQRYERLSLSLLKFDKNKNKLQNPSNQDPKISDKKIISHTLTLNLLYNSNRKIKTDCKSY